MEEGKTLSDVIAKATFRIEVLTLLSGVICDAKHPEYPHRKELTSDFLPLYNLLIFLSSTRIAGFKFPL